MANLKHMNNDMAVSPIVATLVLIVVAVIGAVAVGTIMGTFSSDVSKQANANGAGTAAQTEIVVAGSTTIDPITQIMAKGYTAKNPGVKISSQAMGSGAGVAAAASGVADIGAASEKMPAKWTNTWPNLKSNLIGYGAIVVITNKATPAVAVTAPGLAHADLYDLYAGLGTMANGTWNTVTLPVPVLRADSSGTADSFFQSYCGFASNPSSVAAVATKNAASISANGNAGMIATVASTPSAIGFADYGDVVASKLGGNGITVLSLRQDDGTAYGVGTNLDTQDDIYKVNSQTQMNWFALRDEAKFVYQRDNLPAYGATDKYKYPAGLLRPLLYITNGVPSSSVQNFIVYAANQPYDSDKKMNVFQETNNFCIADLG